MLMAAQGVIDLSRWFPGSSGVWEVTFGAAAVFAAGIPENGHSQEQAPGITPENLASPVARAAELTPENVELLANYSCPGGRAAATRPVATSGTYL